jgi:hypothetical protein
MAFQKKNSTNSLRFNGKHYALLKLKDNTGMILRDDLPFNEVSSLKGYNLPRDIQITCEGRGHMQYKYLEYIHLLRTKDELQVTVEVNYQFQTWSEKINLLSYLELLRDQLQDAYTIHSTQNNIFDEALISVCFKLTADCGTSINSMVTLLDNLLYQEHKNICAYQTMRYKVSLSRRHQQAGKSLLHYLYRVMEYKNLSDDLTVSVSETAHLVTLELRFPIKKKEKIKKAIHYYGLILKGDLSISHLFNEKGQCSDLTGTLTALQKRIAIQNEKNCTTDMEFHTSEEESVWLREHIGNCLASESLIAA